MLYVVDQGAKSTAKCYGCTVILNSRVGLLLIFQALQLPIGSCCWLLGIHEMAGHADLGRQRSILQPSAHKNLC